MDELQDELLKDLEIELSEELHTEKDRKLLSVKVKNAIREVMHKRNYQKGHSKEFISSDMWQFYSTIHNIVIYEWNTIGAEGESGHSEKGTSRNYIDRNKLFSSVVPFATIV